jgi:hypothetical protein
MTLPAHIAARWSHRLNANASHDLDEFMRRRKAAAHQIEAAYRRTAIDAGVNLVGAVLIVATACTAFALVMHFGG